MIGCTIRVEYIGVSLLGAGTGRLMNGDPAAGDTVRHATVGDNMLLLNCVEDF